MNEVLRAMYKQHPDGLAQELGILLEPCTDATFAVLHNAAIQKIMDLCAVEESAIDEFGEKQSVKRVLKCKDKLAKALAEAVLSSVVYEE